MTEVHHGSNVAALQTEAIYEAERDEWVVNTPNDGAIKWYAPAETTFYKALIVVINIDIQPYCS